LYEQQWLEGRMVHFQEVRNMVGLLVLVLVIVTSVWVGVDANTHRVPHG
jgi:hypothetical protein